MRGLGIAQLPAVIADALVAQGQLVRVMAPWHPPAVSVFAVYPSNRYLTPKVRAFVDLALQDFPGATGTATPARQHPLVRPVRSSQRDRPKQARSD